MFQEFYLEFVCYIQLSRCACINATRTGLLIHSSHAGVEMDALGIYTKYLALNAVQPVGVTDETRQRVEGNNYIHCQLLVVDYCF